MSMKTIITCLPILVTSFVAQAQAVQPVDTPAPPDAVRFTVELTDGSRILGSPVDAKLALKTDLGPLSLPWHLLNSIEKADSGNEVSVVFGNGDRAKGTPEANAFALHTVLGDLTVPLALMRRIRVGELVSSDGPVAYWSFNDPASLGADDSGNKHALTVKDAQSTEGKIGKGAATGGPNFGKHFIVDNHPDLQFSGDFTLSVWAWRSAPMYDGDQLISKDGEFSLRRYQLPSEHYDVELCEKHALTIAKLSETKSGLPLEQWTLIVVSRKDDQLSIRVNDLPPVETKVTAGKVGGDSPLYIGSSANGYPWQGKVDEIKKWNRALSEEEQLELFREPPTKPQSNNPPKSP